MGRKALKMNPDCNVFLDDKNNVKTEIQKENGDADLSNLVMDVLCLALHTSVNVAFEKYNKAYKENPILERVAIWSDLTPDGYYTKNIRRKGWSIVFKYNSSEYTAYLETDTLIGPGTLKKLNNIDVEKINYHTIGNMGFSPIGAGNFGGGNSTTDVPYCKFRRKIDGTKAYAKYTDFSKVCKTGFEVLFEGKAIIDEYDYWKFMQDICLFDDDTIYSLTTDIVHNTLAKKNSAIINNDIKKRGNKVIEAAKKARELFEK